MRNHGYPWTDADPFVNDFQRWVPNMEELPAGADALLKARQQALEKRNDHDIAELRDELAKLGVFVKDTKKRQYLRHTTM